MSICDDCGRPRARDAEINRLRAALAEAEQKLTSLRPSVAEIERDEALARAARAEAVLAAAERCRECGGKGQWIVEITNHGERNEFIPKTCPRGRGTGRFQPEAER